MADRWWLLAALTLTPVGCDCRASSEPAPSGSAATAPTGVPCTARVTDGTRSGAAGGATRREALAAACGRMCRKGTTVHDAGRGCVARCTVDAEAGKIGRQVRCGQ